MDGSRISSGMISTLEEFEKAMDLMVSNATTYNIEGSQVYEDALYLKVISLFS